MSEQNSPAPSAPEQAGSAADAKRMKGVPSTGGANEGSIPSGRAVALDDARAVREALEILLDYGDSPQVHLRIEARSKAMDALAAARRIEALAGAEPVEPTLETVTAMALELHMMRAKSSQECYREAAALASELERELAALQLDYDNLLYDGTQAGILTAGLQTELAALRDRLDAPVPEVDEIKARLIAKFPQVDGKTPTLYYMEIAEEYGQLARDLARRLQIAQSDILVGRSQYCQDVGAANERAEADLLKTTIALERELKRNWSDQ